MEEISLTVKEAKDECNATEDCDGFYHYNVNGKDRVCFKKDVTVDPEKQKRTPPGHGGSSGFHVVHGEKPVQPVDQGLYHFYPRLLGFEPITDSSLGCKGEAGGGGVY